MAKAKAKELRVGILGAGSMGKLHAGNLAKCPNVVVDSICALAGAEDISKSVTGGQAVCFTDFDKMLRERSLDALYVCLPPFAHNGQVEKAAAKGLHIFLEKPIALTLARGESMVRAIEKAGVVSQVGYHMRFAPAVRKFQQLVASGKAGRPTLFQGRFSCNALHGDWWRDMKLSGGQLVEQAIHAYDMAMHLLGKPVAVSAFMDNILHRDKSLKYNVDDTSASVIRFDSGAMGTLVASNCAIPMAWATEFRVVCANVTADFSEPARATLTWCDGHPSEWFWSKGKQLRVETLEGPDEGYLEETRNFLAAIAGKGKTLTPAREGLESLRLVLSAAQSAAKNGKLINIDSKMKGTK